MDEPTIADCRYAALRLGIEANGGHGYVVYDRLLNRIVNGVFFNPNALETTLALAESYNNDQTASDMPPNGAALGLIYSRRSK